MNVSALSWQPSLLEARDPGIDRGLGALVGVTLDDESSVGHAPGRVRAWQHSAPKVAAAGPRISLAFGDGMQYDQG